METIRRKEKLKIVQRFLLLCRDRLNHFLLLYNE